MSSGAPEDDGERLTRCVVARHQPATSVSVFPDAGLPAVGRTVPQPRPGGFDRTLLLDTDDGDRDG
jgi:hypothetical protein